MGRWQQREAKACAGHKLMLVSENGTGGVTSDGYLNGDEPGGFLKQLDGPSPSWGMRLHQKRETVPPSQGDCP